jgi:hypothetical protein
MPWAVRHSIFAGAAESVRCSDSCVWCRGLLCLFGSTIGWTALPCLAFRGLAFRVLTVFSDCRSVSTRTGGER